MPSEASSVRSDLPRVLVVHNFYQQPGGEDQVVRSELALLHAHGHAVRLYAEDNATIGSRPSLRTAINTLWSAPSAHKLGQVLREFQPDIAHFHNTFPLISPAAYYACQSAGVPVVQTAHHYRWGCPSANLYRDGHLCTDCLGKPFALPSVLHGCYHNSSPTSAVIALMNTTHRLAGTWHDQVDRYIALSHFQRQILIEAGLPAERISVKSNFVDPDPGPSACHQPFMLFVGRLIPEKGIRTLLDVWRMLAGRVRLKIVGDSPLAHSVPRDLLPDPLPNVEWLGQQAPAEVSRLMGEASALIVPSEWYEPFGLVVIEAFARGTPVIAARSGALPELVQHGQTGLLFTPGSQYDLLNQVHWAMSHPTELAEMGRQARDVFERKHTAEHNYRELLAIYASTLARVELLSGG
jgi:glycosyltransferase involved in cell wall biosynthesis